MATMIDGSEGAAVAWRQRAKSAVGHVKDLLPDYEAASSKELEIYYEFLKTLVESDPKWAPAARELLRISEMKHPRW